MPVIIFGGSGFIGTHLIDRLLIKDPSNKIFNCDLVDKKRLINCIYKKCDVRTKIKINIENSADSIIYNLAAVHKTPGHYDYEYFETNILGAENVCNFARENKINTLIFTSSIATYRASEEIKFENSLPMPNTPYGISKLIAEEIHKRWQVEDPENRKLIILRPGVVFGKGEKGNLTRLYQSLKKRMFVYPGRHDTKKACIYVKDLVRIMLEIDKNKHSGIYIYNMCYQEPHTIKEIISTICDVTGVPKPFGKVPAWILKSSASMFSNIGKITGKQFLGIHPDRITKLMLSTNISGEKLTNSNYHLQYSLSEAINDWFTDCDFQGLF
jgi:nucleoside-diphosphate-sugar epimerase